MDSPPKRMTRARAAAKAKEPTTKETTTKETTTKEATTKDSITDSIKDSIKDSTKTGRTRGPGTATASTKSTAAKRKTRADDNDNDDEAGQTTIRRALRGRPKKEASDNENEEAAGGLARAVATRPTRGRLAKETAIGGTKSAEVAAPAPARGRGRGRPRKVAAAGAEDASKETTRTRVASTAKSSIAGTTKPAIKKTVKFQEPEKENLVVSEGRVKQQSETLLAGRRARRVQASSRSTRAANKTSFPGGGSDVKPLSPKKVTQIAVAQEGDSSEDELAGEKMQTRVSSTVTSPSKRSGSIKAGVKEAAETESDVDIGTCEEQAEENGTVLGAVLPAASPRRLSLSPTKRPRSDDTKEQSDDTKEQSDDTKEQSDDTKEQSDDTKEQFDNTKGQADDIKGLQLDADYEGKPATKSSILQSRAKRYSLKPLGEARRQASWSMDVPNLQALALATPSRAKVNEPWYKVMVEAECGAEDEAGDEAGDEAEDEAEDEAKGVHGEEDSFDGAGDQCEFNGRLSEVVPRHMDPALAVEMEAAVGMEDSNKTVQQDGEVASRVPLFAHQLRPEVLDGYGKMEESDGESDAELVMMQTPGMTTTPGRFAKDVVLGASRRSTLGFTSLTEQFGAWTASSPKKTTTPGLQSRARGCMEVEGSLGDSVEGLEAAVESTFFEDEMGLHKSSMADEMQVDVMVTQEDLCLAQEADEMSMMEAGQIEAMTGGQSFDEAMSEASQEYGDENQAPCSQAVGENEVPIASEEPAANETPRTPAGARMQLRCFHTTTKVPLKAADESTPSPLKKRSMSASKVTCRRRNNASSYKASPYNVSPCKERDGADAWSMAATPAGTGRACADAGLLRGTVVFVDAHTTDGADASGIFVELLSSMGAKCVKTWNWNPSSEAEGEGEGSRIAITHVVYKDGAKRTLERVRQAKGVVQCVGVNWVLDCEGQNKWLDEGPYRIDTSWMPRGGARRRKSMEPKALANINGRLVSGSPAKGRVSRRDSTLWAFAPCDEAPCRDQEHTADTQQTTDWAHVSLSLSPVPKTPAPEAVAKYAAELADDASDMTGQSPTKEQLVMRTCPPKQHQTQRGGLGAGGVLLEDTKDEQQHVFMRLMAARRKSLQFAPKVGSPLAKTWE